MLGLLPPHPALSRPASPRPAPPVLTPSSPSLLLFLFTLSCPALLLPATSRFTLALSHPAALPYLVLRRSVLLIPVPPQLNLALLRPGLTVSRFIWSYSASSRSEMSRFALSDFASPSFGKGPAKGKKKEVRKRPT
ncbi:hypothetical protein E2C01_067276 [Portunus trituberculatus]|uniref:Uncharacterized protein n=1 Tax=Portunus trituberculatus TaxID=210409 RepID=A0A5B7HKK0_PORTR|nr:hypothetical protein [Portunus trituberculatus]